MLRINTGDIWTYAEKGVWVVVTTNTCTKAGGLAVMGRGIAKDAADKYPELQEVYGAYLLNRQTDSEAPHFDAQRRLVLFPTKRDWRDGSHLELIEANLQRFVQHKAVAYPTQWFAFPRLGCANGGLSWEKQVRPLMERYLGEDRHCCVILPESNASVI